jgi:glycerol uptake operon antiterminator
LVRGEVLIDRQTFTGLLNDNPVIAAVKDDDGLAQALESDCNVIFSLFGSVVNVPAIAERIKSRGKACFLHMDLIDGLATREVSIDFIARNTCADGIISTKQNLVKRAAACGLLAVQRFFLLDSLALSNIEKQYLETAVCAIELLPGLMPKIIRQISATVREPVIAGGLINDKSDVMNALRAGACAVSTTNSGVWFM